VAAVTEHPRPAACDVEERRGFAPPAPARQHHVVDVLAVATQLGPFRILYIKHAVSLIANMKIKK
jgi:hypothetical protein